MGATWLGRWLCPTAGPWPGRELRAIAELWFEPDRGRGALLRVTAEPDPRGERVTLGRSLGRLLRATLPLWLRLRLT